MGSLTQGIPLIYEESPDGKIIYSREMGKIGKTVVGQKIDNLSASNVHAQMTESQLWYKIRLAARINPAIQDALDKVVIVYNLSKIDDK